MPDWFKSHSNSLLLLTFLLIAGLCRVTQIHADAPAGDISRSGVFLADEGTFGINAIRWLQTGNWQMPDTFNPGANLPVFMGYEFLLIKIFGKSLATVRYGAVFAGLLSLVLLYVILGKYDRKAGLLAGAFGAINFPLIIYNRLALVENLLLAFAVALAGLILAIQQKPRDVKRICAFWIVFLLGYLTKPPIVFLGLPFLIVVLSMESKDRRYVVMVSLPCIALLSVSVWFFWISRHLDDWQFFQQLNIGDRFSPTPKAVLLNYARYITHIKFYEFMPVLYTVALLRALHGIVGVFRRKRISPVERIFIYWLISGLLFLGFFAYSPPRYSLILLPAVLVLNGLFFAEILDRKQYREGLRFGSNFNFIVIAFVCLLQAGFGIYRLAVYKDVFPSCFLPVLGPIALAALWLFQRHISRRTWIPFVLFGLILATQGFQILRYHLGADSSLYAALRDAADILQHEARETKVLAGDIAAVAAFETDVPVLDIQYRRNRLSELVQREQPGYLLLESPAELAVLREELPGYWEDVTILKRYRIMNNYRSDEDAVLYRLNE